MGAISGTFTGTGQSAAFIPGKNRPFNLTLRGTFVATVKLERSLDGGTNWNTVSADTYGTDASYTAPVALSASEPEDAVQYRWNCTSYTSGTVTYRMGQ